MGNSVSVRLSVQFLPSRPPRGSGAPSVCVHTLRRAGLGTPPSPGPAPELAEEEGAPKRKTTRFITARKGAWHCHAHHTNHPRQWHIQGAEAMALEGSLHSSTQRTWHWPPSWGRPASLQPERPGISFRWRLTPRQPILLGFLFSCCLGTDFLSCSKTLASDQLIDASSYLPAGTQEQLGCPTEVSRWSTKPPELTLHLGALQT